MEERIQGMRASVTVVSQSFMAPKTWLGSEGVNVLRVLCDLLDIVQKMNAQLAEHVHASSPVPKNASEFGSNSAAAELLGEKLKKTTC